MGVHFGGHPNTYMKTDEVKINKLSDEDAEMIYVFCKRHPNFVKHIIRLNYYKRYGTLPILLPLIIAIIMLFVDDYLSLETVANLSLIGIFVFMLVFNFTGNFLLYLLDMFLFKTGRAAHYYED